MAEPFRRTRDPKRAFKPQGKVTSQEWEDITTKAAYASEFMQEGNLPYEIMLQSLKEAEDQIMTNRVREVREEHTISETLKKIFITPKKLQDDEIIGEIKFIRSFLAELKTWIDFKEDLEKQEANGIIQIERNKE